MKRREGQYELLLARNLRAALCLLFFIGGREIVEKFVFFVLLLLLHFLDRLLCLFGLFFAFLVFGAHLDKVFGIENARLDGVVSIEEDLLELQLARTLLIQT